MTSPPAADFGDKDGYMLPLVELAKLGLAGLLVLCSFLTYNLIANDPPGGYDVSCVKDRVTEYRTQLEQDARATNESRDQIQRFLEEVKNNEHDLPTARNRGLAARDRLPSLSSLISNERATGEKFHIALQGCERVRRNATLVYAYMGLQVLFALMLLWLSLGKPGHSPRPTQRVQSEGLERPRAADKRD